MRRKLKHSFLGMSLVAATVAAPLTGSPAGAQGGWNGFETISVPSALEDGDANNRAGFSAGITNDLGGDAPDLWVNNHAGKSEELVDFTGATGVFAANSVLGEIGDTHGVTFSDIDGDGDEDLIETLGSGDPNRVRRNDDGTLVDVVAGLEDEDGRGRTTLMVDIDNDGDMDAIVANLADEVNPSALFLNDGTGSFALVADANDALSDGNVRYAHVTTTGPGEDNVIITSNLFAFAVDTIRTGESTLVAEANPVTQTVGLTDNASNMRDIALGDLDGDLVAEWVAARQDDFLETDGIRNPLFGLPGEDEFTVEPDGEAGDLEGELAIGVGQVSVNDAESAALVDVSGDDLADNCRAVSLADFDNDADLDIFGACTMVETGQTRNIVLLNDGTGSFSIASEALVPATADDTSVVVVNADFNNDGWVDTYVGGGHDAENEGEGLVGAAEDHIFLNEGGSNNWLKVDLEATNNPDAVGAQVFVGTDKWQVRETGHRVHQGQDMRELHFGLGAESEIAPLEIMWPDGTFERCQADGINQTVTITQGGDNCETQTKTGLQANVGATPNLDPLVEEPPALMCNDLVVTVNLAEGDVPTAGDDVIRGTAGNDVINALGGNDTICALQGDDVIDAGDGFDKVFAGAGDDTINGGIGNDLLIGGLGSDTINGGNGNDRIQGGDGVDELSGENGLDRISGGNGNDILRGGKFADELFGNLGRDQLFGDEGDDVLRGGAWKDVMNGGAGSNDGCTLTDPGGLVETRVNCEGGVFGR